jgi:hypothetical protein
MHEVMELNQFYSEGTYAGQAMNEFLYCADLTLVSQSIQKRVITSDKRENKKLPIKETPRGKKREADQLSRTWAHRYNEEMRTIN